MIAMYKTNSYITSLILHQLSKYIKDFNPEDIQILLWKGEAALQNLELCVDALQAIPLPVEFISGHIIELTIIIPWSKLMSEPISIVINTIELVLKVKYPRAETGDTGIEQVEQCPNSDGNESTPSYTQIVAQKILGNISVEINNIIVKIIFENILFSVTAQNISLHSADEAWEKAFANFSLTDLSIRKLAELNGFSICCDEMKSHLKIEFTQEPLVTDFSAKARILRKYSGLSSSTFLIHIFSPLLKFNISSLQIPIVKRLAELIKSVKQKTSSLIKILKVISMIPKCPEVMPHRAMTFVTWAWGLVRHIFMSQVPQNENEKGHYLNLKLFLEDIVINLKTAKNGLERIQYDSLCRITFKWLFFNAVFCKNKWLSTQGGINSFLVEPLGNFKDMPNSYFISAKAGYNDDYMKDSLFTVNHEIPVFNGDLACYLAKYNNCHLMSKSYAFWSDFVYNPRNTQNTKEIKNVATIFIHLSFSELKLSSNIEFIACMKHLCEVIDSKLRNSFDQVEDGSQKFTNLFDDLKKHIPIKDITVPYGKFELLVNIEDKLSLTL